MSSRECFPEDRGGEATQDVAGMLAGIALPCIEPFGPDNPALAGLPGLVPFPVPVPEPLTRLVVARGVYDAGIAALSVLKGLEDALAACKAALLDRVMGAASVEAAAMELDPWQSGMAETSAVSNMALVLRIPEVTAAALVHHSVDLLRHRPGTYAALESGVVSWRHACIVMNELTTLGGTPGVTAADVAGFEARLLVLAVGTTAAGFASKARRARESLFPASMSTRTKEAFATRRMSCESVRDGMSWLTLYLPTLAAESIMTRCTRIARAIKDDARHQHTATPATATPATGAGGVGEDLREHRTLAQLRIDVAAQLLMGQDLPANSHTNPTTNPSANPGTSWASNGAGENFVRGGSHDGAGEGSGGQGFGGVRLMDEEPVWAHRDPAPSFFQDDREMPLVGEVVGDGSGFVDGVVDGIGEDPGQEYLDQLKALRDGGVVAGPPLPEAIVLVTVPFLGLLNLSDEPGNLVGPGGGPVPADIARELLAGSSTFLRVLTDPVTGEMLPLNPERYTLRETEREVLRAMAGSCYFPNCTNPVMLTEFDHLVPFERGGKTTRENARPACRKHHGLKHFKDDKDRNGNLRRWAEPWRHGIRMRGWTPKLTPDGRVGWITPTGAYEPPPAEQTQPTKYPRWLKKRITWQRLTKLRNPQKHKDG